LTKSDTSSAGRRSPAARTLDEVLATLPVDDLKIEPTLWSLTTEATDS
jgi:hypothetical protein